MTEAERIADQLRRAIDGGAWHGPSLSEAQDGVKASQAAARRIPSAHSIWEVTLHVAAWGAYARRRLRGEPVILSPEEDWPGFIDTSEDSWTRARECSLAEMRALAGDTALLTDSRLLDRLSDFDLSVYIMLNGVVQHIAYHAGQIVLLRKL